MRFLIIVICIAFAPLHLAAQLTKDPLTAKYQYQTVEQYAGYTKDELFVKALEWIALESKGSSYDIQFTDQESGKIIVKSGYPTMFWMKAGTLKYTLNIEFKDEKVRFQYNNFIYSDGLTNTPYEAMKVSLKRLLEITYNDVRSSIRQYKSHLFMTNQSQDW